MTTLIIIVNLALIAVVWTMALALTYGCSAYPGTPQLVTIDEMIVQHGSVNAFGFALPALLAFRLGTPESAAERNT